MKKLVMMAAAAVTAMTFTACNNGGKASLKTDVDSIAYDLGVAQAQGLKQYMTMQLGVDSAYIDQFIKGMKEGAVNEANPKKEAYMKGLEVGKQVQQMAKGLSQDGIAGNATIKALFGKNAANFTYTTERLDWFNGGSSVFTGPCVYPIKDVVTGKTFQARRRLAAVG